MIKIGDIIISNLFIGSTQVSKVYLGDVKVWPITTETNYVTFTAQQDNSSIGLTKLSTNQTLEYSTDLSVWNTLNTTTNISLNNGDKVYVRGKLNADNTDSNYTQFKMSGKIASSGNTNSLWDYEDLTAPLKQYCGYRLFYNCVGLIDTSELTLGTSATVLAPYCYNSMFYSCRNLTTAPELPATTLANSCYEFMFYSCTSLTTAPALQATTLTNSCYRYMFSNCTSLTIAPALPDTTLADWCYSNMFDGCSSLITAPELPATTLTNNCYRYMFYGCTSLTTAPELPATILAGGCYEYMFFNCTNLNYIKCLAVNGINQNYSTDNWVSRVAATGTFVKDPNATSWTIGNNGIPTGWVIKDVDTPYVTFTAQEDNSRVGLTKLSTNQTLEYSTDTSVWNTFDKSTKVSLNIGNKVYVRGKLSADNTNTNYTQFSISGKIAVSGNTNSLWDYEDLNAPLKQACGYLLFYDCTGLIDASELTLGKSDTILANSCYYGMFGHCKKLTTAPELPSTILANSCYDEMFQMCTSLTDAPALPATTLVNYCYYYMFRNCTSLNYIKCLATDISATNCTYNWVSGVASTGTFVKDSTAKWSTAANGIPIGWTVQDA